MAREDLLEERYAAIAFVDPKRRLVGLRRLDRKQPMTARMRKWRKAIGWSLREYAKTDPCEVKRYVETNRARLSGLSVREALENP